MHIFSKGRAPNRVFPFLINLLSIANCTSFALVCAEKFKKIVETPFLSFNDCNKLFIKTDLPTPDYPVNIIGF